VIAGHNSANVSESDVEQGMGRKRAEDGWEWLGTGIAAARANKERDERVDDAWWKMDAPCPSSMPL